MAGKSASPIFFSRTYLRCLSALCFSSYPHVSTVSYGLARLFVLLWNRGLIFTLVSGSMTEFHLEDAFFDQCAETAVSTSSSRRVARGFQHLFLIC